LHYLHHTSHIHKNTVRTRSLPSGTLFYISSFLTVLIWPDHGCTLQPKHVAVHYNKRCALTEFIFNCACYTILKWGCRTLTTLFVVWLRLELGLAQWGKNRGWECSRIGCSGRYFGPMGYEVTRDWRRLHNEERYGLYSPNMIQGIKSRRWAGQ
jgi:hypothetical protein